MSKRFAAIWFPHLTTDWLTLRRPQLKGVPFVFAVKDHGRIVVTAATALAQSHGVHIGMPVADAKAIIRDIQVFDERPQLSTRLLKALGEWCIRYTPTVALDHPDGIILDISGCPHLWGGERAYLHEIVTRLRGHGYDVRSAIADTPGAAWAISRFGQDSSIIKSGEQTTALLGLPPAALRLAPEVISRLHKLGFRTIGSFITMQQSALRRRFGQHLLIRLGQALGRSDEYIEPLQLTEPYQERLPCLEPIRTKAGIEIAVSRLLQSLCVRLKRKGKGLRTAVLKCYRVDGKIQQIDIGTNRASCHESHLLKLFDLKIPSIEPALGIELFVLEAPKVEDAQALQEKIWAGKTDLGDNSVSELLDKLASKVGNASIHRYLPDEHYWPERSYRIASSLDEKTSVRWCTERRRPTRLLSTPEAIEVTAPIPDYPPMMFKYKDKTHLIRKADGPERIESEWWLEKSEHRDYYYVEDEEGNRYWLFRLGHYSGDQSKKWFIHGFFA